MTIWVRPGSGWAIPGEFDPTPFVFASARHTGVRRGTNDLHCPERDSVGECGAVVRAAGLGHSDELAVVAVLHAACRSRTGDEQDTIQDHHPAPGADRLLRSGNTAPPAGPPRSVAA